SALPPPPAAAGVPVEQQALALLGDVAVLALEGRQRPPGPPAPVRVPLPLHAGEFLSRLLGVRSPFKQVAEGQAALLATRTRPLQVAPPPRLAHVAVSAVFVLLGCSFMIGGSAIPSFGPVSAVDLEDALLEQTERSLEEITWRDFVGTAIMPTPTVQLQALAQLDADLTAKQTLTGRRSQLVREREARLQSLGWLARRTLVPSMQQT